MQKRTGTPWMSAADYAQTLGGLMVNLLISDMPRAIVFQQQVLGATVVYSDEDFAAIEHGDSKWMLHADHSYSDHPVTGILKGVNTTGGRGAGAEMRLFGCNPDDAVNTARRLDFVVLEEAMDKAHGTREAFIIDDEGYLWVPSITI